MALHTFYVRWQQHTDEGNISIKHTRVLTSTQGTAGEYIRNEYGDSVVCILEIEQEPHKEKRCKCCGTVLSKNYL